MIKSENILIDHEGHKPFSSKWNFTISDPYLVNGNINDHHGEDPITIEFEITLDGVKYTQRKFIDDDHYPSKSWTVGIATCINRFIDEEINTGTC